jgi:GWxTD domain-containing protein
VPALALALCAGLIPMPEPAVAAEQELETWAQGPVRWLLLPGELKELRNLESADGTATYVEVFWQRRDRDPESLGNAYRDAFVERVEAADLLYSDEGIRGSLTDRGRALILMGSPTHITVSTEPIMAFDPAREMEDRVTMRNVDVEIWGYRMEDLPAGVLDIWLARKKKAAEDTLALTLTFRTVGRRTSIVDGEALLEAAAKAAVHHLPSD